MQKLLPTLKTQPDMIKNKVVQNGSNPAHKTEKWDFDHQFSAIIKNWQFFIFFKVSLACDFSLAILWLDINFLFAFLLIFASDWTFENSFGIIHLINSNYLKIREKNNLSLPLLNNVFFIFFHPL